MKRIILTGFLALSATASAQPQPRYDRDPHTDNRPRERDRYEPEGDWDRDQTHYDRLDRWGGYRMYQNRWTSIGNGFTAETNRQFIPANDRVFDKLRLEASRGAPYIYQIAILYTDGTTQVVKLNERLTYGAGEVIRLNGVPVHRFVVYTEPRYRGSYNLFAAQRPYRNRIRS